MNKLVKLETNGSLACFSFGARSTGGMMLVEPGERGCFDAASPKQQKIHSVTDGLRSGEGVMEWVERVE